MLVKDVGKDQDYASPNVRSILGYSTEDLTSGKVPYASIIHPGDADRVEQTVADALRGKISRIEHAPYRLLRKDGTNVWVLDHTTIFRNANGQVVHYLGYLVDITELHSAQEALRADEERLDLVMKGAELGLWDWDIPSGNVVYSDRWAEMLGYRVDEIQPNVDAWRELVHPSDLPLVEKALAAHLEGSVPIYQTEHRLRHKSGNWVWIQDTGKVLGRNEKGDPIRVVGTHRDITRDKERLEQMLSHERLAAVGRVAGGMAHDFNNILTSILSFAQLLRSTPGTTPSMNRGLQVIEKSGERAVRLVRQLLDFSRKTITTPRRLDLGTFTEETAEILRQTIPENITVLVSTVGVEEHAIHADPTQIRQVLTNLALNSADAMPGGGSLLLSVSIAEKHDGALCTLCGRPVSGRLVRLAVTDSGHGISEDVLPQVFEPFFTTKEVGTGLGLSQVAGIVAQHHGHITVHSTTSGTEFSIYFPICALPADEIPSVPSSDDLVEGFGETILLVEDNDLVREALAEALSSLNYRIMKAANGEEALAAHSKHRRDIALVLSDLVMPGIDGAELFHALKERDPEIKLIIMSGYPLGEKGGDLVKSGIVAWIEKPMSVARLSQVISQALDTRGV